MAEIELCSVKRGDDVCNKPATLGYRWEWGETGICCAECAGLLQQTAGNISRSIAIAPRAAAAEPPLERSERTQLIAARLSAEAEMEEVKARGAELYRSNVDLTGQVQRLTVQHREQAAQLRDAAAREQRILQRLRESETERADLVLEVERLRTLVPFVPTPTQPET